MSVLSVLPGPVRPGATATFLPGWHLLVSTTNSRSALDFVSPSRALLALLSLLAAAGLVRVLLVACAPIRCYRLSATGVSWPTVDYTPDEKFQRKGTRRDPNKPKRAMSAYLYFCEAHRESVKSEFPEKKMIEVQKVLGDRWKDTPEHQRRPYILQADADRERYDAAMLRAAQNKPASGGRHTDAAGKSAAGEEEDEDGEEEEEEEEEEEGDDDDDDDGDE